MKAKDTIIGAEAVTYQTAHLLYYKNKFDNCYVENITIEIVISVISYYSALAIKRDYSLEFQQLMAHVDVLITPSFPVPPPLLTLQVIQLKDFNEDILG